MSHEQLVDAYWDTRDSLQEDDMVKGSLSASYCAVHGGWSHKRMRVDELRPWHPSIQQAVATDVTYVMWPRALNTTALQCLSLVLLLLL